MLIRREIAGGAAVDLQRAISKFLGACSY